MNNIPNNCPYCGSEHVVEDRKAYHDEHDYTIITKIESHVYCEECGKTISHN